MVKRVSFLTVLLAVFGLSAPRSPSCAVVRAMDFCNQVSEPSGTCQQTTDHFFSQAPEIHAVVQLQVAEPSVTLRGTWISVDAIDVPNYPIASSEVAVFEDANAVAHFSLSKPVKDWPTGKYRLDLFASEELIGRGYFTIGADGPTRQPTVSPLPRPDGDHANLRKRADESGNMYRHVIGFSFWYPAAWKVEERDDFLQLVPPDAATTPDGPAEVFFIIGESVAGENIFSAGDPKVLSYMDGQVQSISPSLQRSAGPVAAAMSSGQGVVLDWQGSNPKGQPIRARAYVGILNQHGVALLALGLDDHVDRRDASLRRIFASFGFGSGERDPRLAGSWTFLTTHSMTNWSPFETSYSRAQMASESSAVLTFNADGSWSRTDKSYMIAGAGGVWLENNDTKVSRGRWNAGSGSLYMVWEDNSWEDYTYELRQTSQGLQLLLVTGKQGELWQRRQ